MLLRTIGSRGVVAACVCAGALALAAVPALADQTRADRAGSALNLSVSSSGPNLSVTATGTNAPYSAGGIIFGTDYNLVAYLVEAGGPQCSDTQTGELDIESYPVVTQITTINNFDESTSGSFTLSFQTPAPIGYSGSLTVCAYSVNGYDTVATTSGSGKVTAPKATSTTPSGGGKAPGGGGGKPGAPKTSRPRVVARPRVTRHGHQLLCSRGRWSGKPKSYRYKWLVTRQVGSPSFTSRLAITRKMHGQQAECQVTASNSKGRATATSKPVKIS